MAGAGGEQPRGHPLPAIGPERLRSRGHVHGQALRANAGGVRGLERTRPSQRAVLGGAEQGGALRRARAHGPLKSANPQMKVLAGAFVAVSTAAGRCSAPASAAATTASPCTSTTTRCGRSGGCGRCNSPTTIAPRCGSRSRAGRSCASHAANYQGHRCVTRVVQARFTADLVASVRRHSGPIAALLIYTAQDQASRTSASSTARGARSRCWPRCAAPSRAASAVSPPAPDVASLGVGPRGLGLGARRRRGRRPRLPRGLPAVPGADGPRSPRPLPAADPGVGRHARD